MYGVDYVENMTGYGHREEIYLSSVRYGVVYGSFCGEYDIYSHREERYLSIRIGISSTYSGVVILYLNNPMFT